MTNELPINSRRTKPPEFKEKDGELLLRHCHGPVPFGWEWHPNEHGYICKNKEQYEAIAKAIQYFKNGCSMLGCARWLSIEVGRRITNEGLKYIMTRGY